MAAFQRIRLDAARTEMLRAERGQQVARIAAEHGFSNPSRFARLFCDAYGAFPSEVLRTRRGLTRDTSAQAPQPDRSPNRAAHK
jgi:transcriptional regulator GlxA family with amidase domain